MIDAILEFEENNGYMRPAEALPMALKNKPTPNAVVSPEKLSDDLNSYPKVIIIIHSDEKFDGRDDVLVWLNGRSFQIQRDQEVIIPGPAYRLLLDAKSVVYQQERDGSLTQRTVQNHNIAFIGNA